MQQQQEQVFVSVSVINALEQMLEVQKQNLLERCVRICASYWSITEGEIPRMLDIVMRAMNEKTPIAITNKPTAVRRKKEESGEKEKKNEEKSRITFPYIKGQTNADKC